jgi:hypothetical protein
VLKKCVYRENSRYLLSHLQHNIDAEIAAIGERLAAEDPGVLDTGG